MRKTHNFVFNGKSEATTMTISSLNLFWQSMPLLTLQLTVYNGKCLVVGFTSTNPLAMTYRSIFVCFLETRYEGDGFYRFHNGQGMGGFRRRIIWLLLSLVMTGLMIWKVIETFQEHNSNPIFTKVIERKVPRERFPSVRICPTGLLQGVPLEQLDSKTNNFVRKLREVDSWTARLAERLTASEDDDMVRKVTLNIFSSFLSPVINKTFLRNESVEVKTRLSTVTGLLLIYKGLCVLYVCGESTKKVK